MRGQSALLKEAAHEHNFPMINKSLMSIPSEIRVKILRKLLWSERPLQRPSLNDLEADALSAPEPTIDTTILRVCKALHREGIDILYNNTIVISARVIAPRLSIGTFLDKSFDLQKSEGRIPNYFDQNVRKLRFDIITRDDDSADDLYELLSDAVIWLSAKPRLSTLTIVFVDCENSKPSSREIMRNGCQFFGYLRGLQLVRCNLMTDISLAWIPQLMQTRESVINLVLLYHSLWIHVDSWHMMQTPGWTRRCEVSEYLKRARTARNESDLASFRQAEMQIMRCTGKDLEIGEDGSKSNQKDCHDAPTIG